MSGIVLDGSYAAFPMGDSLCDRLEALAGVTTYVDIPLVRTNMTAKTASCKLRFTFDGNSTEQSVAWTANESFKLTRYTLPSGLDAGEQVLVTLVDATGAELATRHIWCLTEVENSPKNPYWIGEKTADSLTWGEWSMDLDVVTNKVNAWNAAHPSEPAYAMAFVGGSCWCPDCAMAEENFFNKQAFKDWAVAHRVVFGVLDIPNNPQIENATPSQLRYESNRTSDSYVTLRNTVAADETQRYQSGAGYLSRHGVAYAQALEVAERNAYLMGHDTLHGGWNRPERANKNRTGVPVLLLLRADGSIAARWNRFSDVGPAAYYDGYLKRFEEMFALLADAHEEADCDATTTLRTISAGDTIDNSVSSVDQADVFAIADAAENLVVRYYVTGDKAAALSADVVDAATGTSIASLAGDATTGFTVSAKLGASNYYLKLAPANIADGGFFGYTNETSSVCSYRVVASSGMSGGEIGFVTVATNVSENCGTVDIAVARTAGSAGTASVKVKLVAKSGTGVEERIGWTDTTLAWANGEAGVKSATLTIQDDVLARGDMLLSFALSDLAGTAEDLELGADAMVVNVYDDEVFGVQAYRYVSFAETRAVEGYQAGDEIVLTAKSGTLPAGVSIAAANGTVSISGIATDEGGAYTAVYGVSLLRDGSTVPCDDITFALTVTDYDFAGDIPSLATTRTYDNLPHLVADGERTLVAGLLTVTVPKNGQLSAKYLSEGQTFAYASAGWTSFDVGAGILTAALARTDDPAQTMSVTLKADGGTVSFVDPLGSTTLTFDLPAEIWPSGAAAYSGQYTVQMPQTNIVDGLGATARAGAAYMALRMVSEEAVAAGQMLYAGVLPNGRSFYASRTLIPDASCCSPAAALPFYHYSDMKLAGYTFSGGFSFRKNAASEYKTFRWSVTAAWANVWQTNDEYAHASDFNVYGGYYDCSEITDRFNEDYAGRTAGFALVVTNVATGASGRYGAWGEVAPVSVTMTATNMPELAEYALNPQEMTLKFSLGTGVISGSFYLPFESGDVAVLYRGICLPGWQGCGTCTTGSFVERPWAAGACSFTDRKVGVGFYRNGCAILMDTCK